MVGPLWIFVLVGAIYRIEPASEVNTAPCTFRHRAVSGHSLQFAWTAAMRRKHLLQSLGCFPIADILAVRCEQPVGAQPVP